MEITNTQKTFLQSEYGRKWFIEKALEATSKDDNWQKNHTPYDIVCERMIEKTSLKDKKILILFNIEFIEILVKKKKIPPSKIYFAADCNIEKDIANKIYKLDHVTIVKDLDEIKKFYGQGETEQTEMEKKLIDLCFSNPPYNRGMDLKIITNTLKICKEMVAVHPSTWILDMKNAHIPYTVFKKLIYKKLKSVTFFNGNPVFNGMELFVPSMITHIKDNDGLINVDYFGDVFEASSVNEITRFGSNWKLIVKPFFQKIQNYVISKNDNLWKHNKTEIDGKKYYCQFAAIKGTPYRGNDIGAKLETDDFYTMLMKNSEENKGIRQPNLKRPGNPTPTFEFETESELNNFILYCQTDFARFCLALYKSGQNISVGGVMNLIPWMDFTETWTDEKLYEHFEIDQDTINYIKSFLPDYHELRK